MRIDSFLEALSGILSNPEELLVAFEEAIHLGMNQLYVLMGREKLRLVMVIQINPFAEEVLSLVIMIPLGCGEAQPSMESANKLARELGGVVMAYGDCSSVLIGYDGSRDLVEFIESISQKVLGEKANSRFSVEHYSYDLFLEYLENT